MTQDAVHRNCHFAGARRSGHLPNAAAGDGQGVAISLPDSRMTSTIGIVAHDDMSAQRDRREDCANAPTAAEAPVGPAPIVEAAPARRSASTTGSPSERCPGSSARGAKADATSASSASTMRARPGATRHRSPPSPSTRPGSGHGPRGPRPEMIECGRRSAEEQTTSARLVVRKSCGVRTRGIGVTAASDGVPRQCCGARTRRIGRAVA